MRAQSATGMLARIMCVSLLMGLAFAAALWAQPAGNGNQNGLREEPVQVIRLFAGQSRILDAPWPVRRVSVMDPSIADVDVTSPQRVQLQGKSPGVTEVVMWSDADQTWQARIEVETDLRRLDSQLKKMFPSSALEVSQLGNVVVVKGLLTRAEQVPQLRRFMELSNYEFVDATHVAGVQQVQLQVRVAEVSRTALRAMGINAVVGGKDFFGGVQIGSSSGPFVPMNAGIPAGASAAGNLPFEFIDDVGVPASATLFGGFPNADLQVFIQALAENQYLRVLAEPTLVALSGQEASFLAGGEFPIPIAQLGSGGTTAISIEYREFGVRLRFRPTVLGNGTIHLHVLPEVSELSDVGSVQVLGTRVPSVLSRRVETTLELQSGQTFAIAGLINQSTNARNSSVPGLGDVPVLGALFRSTRYQSSETELLVLVTAALVEPSSMVSLPPVPGALHAPPGPWELYAEGRIESRSRARLAPAQAEKIKQLGLNNLRGPGGWATYDSPEKKLAGDGASATGN